ncbi:MAG: ZIP zinc transporter [Candidatus Niyogibacteria bacterium CG10_big_fil_rev_8_21_14_0_10_42_19]|uniref:ZIP zinc transporter n=1 Tax=Candidatus Niyogibacteria bacterium CG10_big_fil_rev_8_21_14_0_10_42_19 TaxID=1974725 RepID=A0A2H0TI77_9BACT|nr:MAG: ZIP zinc transporter [Candidatus Niyogibacteria bacterium CG10_big_fil_rev_8_21_14_0_10_42_19]
MSLLFIILGAALFESLISFSGALFMVFNREKALRATHYLVSFAVGALMSVALLDIIPEAIERSSIDKVMPFVLLGVIMFFIFEKFLFWYHCHHGECKTHTHHGEPVILPYAYLILWGDFLHNFIDGIILALAFLVDLRLGFLTLIAVILHEIPQEIGDFGVLVHGGMKPTKALFFNFLTSLSTMAGAILTYILGPALIPVLPYALAIVAGNFIYIAGVDLIPELHEARKFKHSLLQVMFIIIGALLVIAPEFIFH